MPELRIICNAATGFMPGILIPEFRSKRAEVRWKVRHLNLSALDRETRQAAAADPAIIWDEEDRQYRFRRKSDGPRPSPNQSDPSGRGVATPPAPAPADDGGDPAQADGEGGTESSPISTAQTGGGVEFNIKPRFRAQNATADHHPEADHDA